MRELGDVREWKESRTVARPGSQVKPGDAYSAYKWWCIEMGKEPVSLTAFGTIMKGELGVLYEEKPKSKRGYYVGIALVGAPKLVTATIDSAPAPPRLRQHGEQCSIVLVRPSWLPAGAPALRPVHGSRRACR